jgi:putative photosynthetic complex assembly protein
MSHAHHNEPFPRRALIGAGALVGTTLLLTGAVSLGLIAKPKNAEQVRVENGLRPAASRTLTFADVEGGGLEILDVGSGSVATVIQPGEQSGFIRGVLRGLMRERRMAGLSLTAPFDLTLWENGRLSLRDTLTGRTIELGSFGADNRNAFLRLVQPKVERQL